MKKSAFCKFAGVIAMSAHLLLGAGGPNDGLAAEGSQAATESASDNVVPTAPSEGPLSRWLTLDDLSFGMRYRNSASTLGMRDFDSVQEKSLASGKFKFDKEGKYGVHFRASSGRYFNWSYATIGGVNFTQEVVQYHTLPPAVVSQFFRIVSLGDTGKVPQARGWEFYVRELYLTATPIKALTFEFGGLGLERGVGSELTNFDDDGYMVGERIRVRDKEHLYFDEVTGTFGYFGDKSIANFFARGDRLAENNYRQISVQKNFGKRVKGSFGYDWIFGINTLREAARVNVAETRVLDNARVEFYQRTNSAALLGGTFGPGSGWGLVGNKSLLRKRFQLEGGYDDIDRYNGVYANSAKSVLAGFSLNGDSYQIGKRIFARASYTPIPVLTFFGFYTHQVAMPTDPSYFALNHQTWQGGATINFKTLLDKSGLF